MTTIIRKGTVTITVFSNETITHEINDPGYIIADVRPAVANSAIVWDNGTSPAVTISQLLSNKQWASGTKLTTTLTVTGNQFSSGFSATITTDLLGRDTSHNYLTYTTTTEIPAVFDSRFPFKQGPTTINTISGYSNFQLPIELKIASTGFQHNDAYNVTAIIVIDISASINCSGQNLQSSPCISECTENPSACLQAYIEYCQPNVLENNQVCQTFITNYLNKNGPSKQLDDVLQRYCTSRYTNLESLFDPSNKASPLEQNICACHMQDSEYVAIQERLTVEFPQIGAIYSQIPRCMVPQCVSSSYPSIPMPPTGCKIPNCLQISVFDLNGQFSNNTVEVTQTCINDGGDGGINIATVVAIVLVILLILLIIYLIL